MTEREWHLFALELDKSFRGEFGPQREDDADGAAQEAVYRHHLGGLPYEEATAALALLVQRGQVFRPEPGEIVTAHAAVAARGAPPVSWPLAWRMICRAYDRHGDSPGAVEQITRRAGEGAARFVQAHGLRSLMMEPVHGDYGGAVLKRLGDSYAEHVERAADDRRVGLALEQARRGELGRGTGPRRLNAAKAIGGGRG